MGFFVKLRGMRDILPEEIDIWRKVEQKFIEISELFGFKEIRVPILESKYLFEKGIGRDTDIVMKEMYEFKDKKGRDVVLRPEGTASVVRAYIENKIYEKRKIARFYYLGPMFRYDRPQKGRYRQFYQFGVECFGGKSFYFDGETILLLNTVLEKLNIENSIFLINSLGCKDCKVKYTEHIKGYLEKIIDKLCNDCKIRFRVNPLRVFDCKNYSCQQAIENLSSIYNFLCKECKEHFDLLVNFLENNKINFKIEYKLVRGLDYYTKTVYEVFCKNQDIAIAGGGRYDYLVEEMGGPNTPAVGFAVGIDRIVTLLNQEKKDKDESVYLIFLGEQARVKGCDIMKKLIENKIKVEVDYEERTINEHLRIANKYGKRLCLILGENEIKKGVVVIKNMDTRTQEEIKEEEIVKVLKERIK
ncbi:MAG: histidine--tRNA ligase [Candidatus Omnitrophica bacterium]|nr:histidine--tRNA ligase [Candidatus Omnitrophota bacterium]MCM8810578.1 histidine--tRNA ligase [Candidatus Omnitrophota bacterium]